MDTTGEPGRRHRTRRWMPATGAAAGAATAGFVALHSPAWALALGTAAAVFAALADALR